MNKDKVKLLDLPLNILKSIFFFFEPERLFSPIMQVSKTFNELASDPDVMTICFFNAVKVPLSHGGREFSLIDVKERAAIIKDIFWPSGINDKITMTPYYTDGGIDKNDPNYFITNIYADEPSNLYSSARSDNIHIKAILSDALLSHIDLSDITKYKVPQERGEFFAHPNHTYILPIKSLMAQYEPQSCKQFGILKYHDLNRNIQDYTCFLQSFVLFLSMEEIDVNHPLVKLFDNVKKLEQMEKLGFEYAILQSTEDTQVVEFKLQSLRKLEESLQKNVPGAKLNGVYPFIWGDVSKTNVNYLNITQRIGFRYMLLKLIDSHKTKSDSNIDCYNILPSGSLIKLKSTFEE